MKKAGVVGLFGAAGGAFKMSKEDKEEAEKKAMKNDDRYKTTNEEALYFFGKDKYYEAATRFRKAADRAKILLKRDKTVRRAIEDAMQLAEMEEGDYAKEMKARRRREGKKDDDDDDGEEGEEGSGSDEGGGGGKKSAIDQINWSSMMDS
jgi:hypothetical protein